MVRNSEMNRRPDLMVAAMNVTVMGNLASKGLFRDRIGDQIDDEFLPWLATEVVSRVEVTLTSRQVLGRLLSNWI